jgi:hypothetical protein
MWPRTCGLIHRGITRQSCWAFMFCLVCVCVCVCVCVHRTDLDGPAMTWGMYAVGLLDAGNYSGALPLFLQGYANAQQPFKVWTESADGSGTAGFITGAGGFLQSVINGYGGLRLTADLLNLKSVAPALPTTKIVLQVCNHQGRSPKKFASALLLCLLLGSISC